MIRRTIGQSKFCVGEEIKLSGWVHAKRDHGKMTFIDLRDRSGKIQCVARGLLSNLSLEDVIEIVGTVNDRPEKDVKSDVPLGNLEVNVLRCKVLNHSLPVPIPTHDGDEDATEDKLCQYRYLGLRREKYSKILRLRSEFVMSIRRFLHLCDFTEVETPILTQPTSEGARDFIVPSRFYPGSAYALPQSPQQYKQLLMTAGLERYYQIARCFRDEAVRSDRSFEFTQLDLEMSFESEGDIVDFVNKLVRQAVIGCGGKIRAAIPVFSYAEAMEKYGSDKFDMRTAEEKENGVLAFAWVNRFPFFKKKTSDDRDGREWTFTHNPFSLPVEEHREWHLRGENVGKIQACQYDLVCNGHEVGGGSLRAYTREMLAATYKIMGYTDQEIQASVGHMLEAFDYGTPPHGGIALGIDRLVMLLSGADSLKDVVAFPMTSSGRTSVMDGPSNLTQEQLSELGYELKKA